MSVEYCWISNVYHCSSTLIVLVLLLFHQLLSGSHVEQNISFLVCVNWAFIGMQYNVCYYRQEREGRVVLSNRKTTEYTWPQTYIPVLDFGLHLLKGNREGNSEITRWQAPFFIKSEICTCFCMCELKSEMNFAPVPRFNYKSALTSNVWKKSPVIIITYRRYKRTLAIHNIQAICL